MRLLFVGTGNGGGGTESHFITLAKAMSSLNHDVAVVVQSGTPIHKSLIESNVMLYFGFFRNATDLRGFVPVWKAISQFKPDWIIGSFSKEYWPLTLLCKLRKIKLALFKHMDYPLRFMTHHFIPRLADRFIVISNFMLHSFINRGICAARIQMLYNPLDINYFKVSLTLRQSRRSELGYCDDDCVIGFVGAMHPDKGMLPLCDALNQAIKQNPRVKAIWLGDGLATNDLKIKIQTGGFPAHHQCYPWTDDVRPYFAVIDILAVPTLITESFGRVSIEAQALGIPVLCSNLGGLPETLLPDVTGKLLPVGDVTAWRDAILDLTNDASHYLEIKNNGRQWVSSQFGTEEIAKKFTAILSHDQVS